MTSSKNNFQEQTRKVFNLIRAQHHLGHARRALDTGQTPMDIKSTQRWLEGTIRPALLTTVTAHYISGNAINWAQTSLQILLEHYETLQKDLQRTLDKSTPIDWAAVWRVALRWAQRRLRSLNDQTIKTVIQNLQEMGIQVPVPAKKATSRGPFTRKRSGAPQGTQEISDSVIPNKNPNMRRASVAQISTGETNETEGRDMEIGSQVNTRVEENVSDSMEISSLTSSMTVMTGENQLDPPVTTEESEEQIRSDNATGTDISQQEEQMELELHEVHSQMEIATPKKSTLTSAVTTCKVPPGPIRISDVVTTRLTPRKSVSLKVLSPEKNPSPKVVPDVEWLSEEESLDWGEQIPNTGNSLPTPLPRREPRAPPTTIERTKSQNPALITQTPPGPSSSLDGDLDFLQFLRDTPKFTKHNHNGDKYTNWSLKPERPVLILGDSNMARLPLIEDEEVQVDCFPGATLGHAIHVIRNKTGTSPRVKTVILAFGLNDRNQNKGNVLQNSVNRLLKVAKDTFPYANILIPLMNHSEKLKLGTQRNIGVLNDIFRATNQCIPCLQQVRFKTERDKIHWSVDTGVAMWEHWRSFLALGVPQFK